MRTFVRKIWTAVVSGARSTARTVGRWFDASFRLLWSGTKATGRGVKATARFAVNTVYYTTQWVALVVGAAAYLVLSGFGFAFRVLEVLLGKAITLVLLVSLLPFFLLKGELGLGLRAIGMTLRHWHVTSLLAAFGTVALAGWKKSKEARETVTTESGVEVTITHRQSKGHPTPKQRKHRPTRPAFAQTA